MTTKSCDYPQNLYDIPIECLFCPTDEDCSCLYSPTIESCESPVCEAAENIPYLEELVPIELIEPLEDIYEALSLIEETDDDCVLIQHTKNGIPIVVIDD